jgi:predicted component of type VI protein secretion system
MMARLAIRIAGQEEVVVEVPAGGAVLGRESGCDIILNDASVSRQHCRISALDAGFSLSDLGSRNPTLLNGQRIAGTVFLHTGDLIKAGRAELLYVCSAAENCAAPLSSPENPAAMSDAVVDATGMAEEFTGAASSGTVPENATSTLPAFAALDDSSSSGEAKSSCLEPEASVPPVSPDGVLCTGRQSYAAISAEEMALPVFAPEPAPNKSGKRWRKAATSANALELAAERQARARNDFWAKLIVLAIFGIPAIAIDAYLIWYFFLQK